jgi:hypothetical protein
MPDGYRKALRRTLRGRRSLVFSEAREGEEPFTTRSSGNMKGFYL